MSFARRIDRRKSRTRERRAGRACWEQTHGMMTVAVNGGRRTCVILLVEPRFCFGCRCRCHVRKWCGSGGFYINAYTRVKGGGDAIRRNANEQMNGLPPCQPSECLLGPALLPEGTPQPAPTCLGMPQSAPTWLGMAQRGPTWLGFARCAPTCSGMPKHVPPYPNASQYAFFVSV